MSVDNEFDYSKYTVTELYDAYRQIDREQYSNNFAEIIKEIQKRFNLPEDKPITDEYMVELYFEYCSSKISPTLHGRGDLSYDDSATRLERFGAAIIDGLITGTPVFILMISLGFENYINYSVGKGIIAQITLLIFGQTIYLLVNSFLLYKYGQTVGKKLVGIKIVTIKGQLPTFFNIYFMRYLITAIIATLPLIGYLFNCIDCLFIFRENKRCVHDYIAGTRVVKV
jgi:uncharacterized RDD family membrane protein YckC